MSAPVAPPRLPYTLRPEGRPVAVLRHRLRTRGALVLAAAIVLGAAVAIASGEVAAALFPIAFLGGIVLLVAVLGLPLAALYGRSSVTVTDEHVVVRRLRRRVLARAEAGDVVLGFFTVAPLDFTDAQVCLTRRDGTRFATLPATYWDFDGITQIAAALGTEPRWQDARDERLRPFYVRHLWATAFGGGLALAVVIVAAIVAYDAIAAHQRGADAARVLRSWNADVAPRLRALPGVRSVDADKESTRVAVDYGGAEIAPGPARRLNDLVCAHRARSLRVAVSYVDRSDPQLQDGRRVRFECDAASDPGSVLAQLARRPLARSVRYASLELSTLRDFHDRVLGTRLALFATQTGTSTADLTTTLDAACALRAARGQLELQVDVTAGKRETSLDRCSERADAVARWTR